MPHWAKSKCVYIPENGVDLDYLNVQRKRFRTPPLQGAFVGRLVPYKGADVLLQAASEYLRNGQLELHIIGDGPQRASLEDTVDQLRIRDAVWFHGWLPHSQVQQRLKDYDFMVLPSIREFGGGVVVEAMALGVTPIVADYAGPSELVDDRTGIRVPFWNEESLVTGVRAALGAIIRSPQTLDELGRAAREKVREKLTWDAKAKQILAIYEAVLGGETTFSHLGSESI
jgi:glycosyltransferase involved in cell wall biosynthesis